jgi:hypothetical protein
MVRKKGGISTTVFTILIIMVIVVSLLVFLETKTLDIKRRNIHNAVIGANLALYTVIEQGDKTALLYTFSDLQNYILNPGTIPQEKRNEIINLATSEYFPQGEKYKSVYIEKTKAIDVFKEYLCKNLNLIEQENNIFVSANENNLNFIKQIELKEFFIHNALSDWDEDKNVESNDIKNNRYTGVHVYLEAEIYNGVKIYGFKGTTIVPIHIDTDITLFRFT